MIETSLNIFDTTVIIIMVLSCLIAFFRGFVREILSLGSWVGAGIVTLYYFKPVAEYLKPQMKSEMVAAGLGTLGLYIISLIFFSLISMMLLKLMKSGNDVGMLDNLLGVAFGAFRGAFIISLGFFMLTIVLPEREYPEFLQTSVTREYVENGAALLASISPDYLQELSSLHEKAADIAEKRSQGYEQSDYGEIEEQWDEFQDSQGYSNDTF